MVYSLVQPGALALETERYREAREYFDEGLVIGRDLSSTVLMADVLLHVASLAAATGRVERAIELALIIRAGASDDQEVVNHADEQLAKFAAHVAPEIVAACQARSRRQDIASTAAEVLSEPVLA